MKRYVGLGGKPASTARKMTLTRLAKIREALAEISQIWSDVDHGIECECEDEVERYGKLERDWIAMWADFDAEARETGGAA